MQTKQAYKKAVSSMKIKNGTIDAYFTLDSCPDVDEVDGKRKLTV